MPRENERTNAADPGIFIKRAKRFAMEAYNTSAERNMYPPITEDQVFVVWFSKTLQNWKAMVSTTVPLDSAYFEVTHNGDTGDTYVDMYFKASHTTITQLD